MTIFSKNELQGMTHIKLARLAKYYHVEYNGLTKDQLVEALWSVLDEKDPATEAKERGVSVEILRILKSQEKKNV